MQDVQAFNHLLDKLENFLWNLRKVSENLQEFRRDIQFQWNDEASRELNTRCLNPQEEDDIAMMGMLVEQQTKLIQLSELLATIYLKLEQADQLSLEISRLLQQAQLEIDRAYSYYDQFIEHHTAARDLLPRAHLSMEQANSIKQLRP
jgi:hypothetical protein